jgi:hypothetical protein
MINKIIEKINKVIFRLLVLPLAKKANTRSSSKIPKIEIEEKHIKNVKLLTNREELIKALPKHGIVAELGVDEGCFSEIIINIAQPKKLHLIDFWGSKRYNQEKRTKVEQKFAKKIEVNLVEINLGLSTQVVDSFTDRYFDWIYIDTSHSYETTIAELELYREKVKEKGIIAGHDYILGNWNGLVRYGVIEAVYEFCVKYDWEIIFLTAELNNNPSFAIRRINIDSASQ